MPPRYELSGNDSLRQFRWKWDSGLATGSLRSCGGTVLSLTCTTYLNWWILSLGQNMEIEQFGQGGYVQYMETVYEKSTLVLGGLCTSWARLLGGFVWARV